MADPPAWMDPVVHDPSAFHDAMAEVDATITRLTAAMDDRLARADALAARWHGTSASRFAGDHTRRLLAVHHDVVGELEATRRNLHSALDAIEAEDASRARQRQQWRLDRLGAG